MKRRIEPKVTTKRIASHQLTVSDECLQKFFIKYFGGNLDNYDAGKLDKINKLAQSVYDGAEVKYQEALRAYGEEQSRLDNGANDYERVAIWNQQSKIVQERVKQKTIQVESVIDQVCVADLQKKVAHKINLEKHSCDLSNHIKNLSKHKIDLENIAYDTQQNLGSEYALIAYKSDTESDQKTAQKNTLSEENEIAAPSTKRAKCDKYEEKSYKPEGILGDKFIKRGEEGAAAAVHTESSTNKHEKKEVNEDPLISAQSVFVAQPEGQSIVIGESSFVSGIDGSNTQ